MADALGRGFDAGRPVVRGGTADARARAHTCRHSLARCLGCRDGRPAGRLDTCIRIYVYIYLCVCACVCYTRIHTYIIHFSVYVRIGRGYACVRHSAMVMDRLCAHALAGSCCGLGLKPKPLNRASPCPSASTAWWLRRAGVLLCVGVQREHRRVEHRVGVEHARGMRLSGPAARTMADALGRASVRRGPLCAAAPPMRARDRTRAGTRLRGASGVGTAGRRGGSIHASEYMYMSFHVCLRVCVTRVYIPTLSIFLHM
jgi:hypothetical protein